ncbi:MAG: hypothetical protein HZC29_08815 [Thaumarchaeota archaeon]|nr:hypothetical protein [Nitrososphaerota archaeon]
MSKFKIRTLKQEQIEFMKSQKAKLRKDDYTSRIYLDNSINILESELNYGKYDEELKLDPKHIKPIIDLGIPEDEAGVLACFMTSEKPLSVKTIFERLDVERGHVYRVCTKYANLGVLTRTSIGVTRFHLSDRECPFKPIIEDLESKADKYRKFSVK